jgi:hypothetical protein
MIVVRVMSGSGGGIRLIREEINEWLGCCGILKYLGLLFCKSLVRICM